MADDCNGNGLTNDALEANAKDTAAGRKGRCIGIDLGTTYSAVAFLDANDKPETIRSDEGELTTPSVVFFDSQTTVVGREAVKAAEYDSTRVARYAKRHVGEKHFPKEFIGKKLPPEAIQALILRKLKADADRKLGETTDAVITVPAFFNEPKRKSTQDAGAMAGLNVLDIINEPTAAAIAYGIQEGFVDLNGASHSKELVLVYDLGGGTFDATIMEIDGKRFDSIATAGDVYLGGADWDKRLLDHIADQFETESGIDLRKNASSMERLIQEAESAKKTLTVRDEAIVRIGDLGREYQIVVSRSLFEELTTDLLERTRMTCCRLFHDAGLAWSDLTRLILVGGSTRMPMVRKMLESESGLTVDRTLPPDEAVAHGAALYADSIRNQKVDGRNISVSNINSHDLGVLGIDTKTNKQRRQVMIARNSRIPTTNCKRFLTAKEGQNSVVVSVVEGGTATGNFATQIGECVVTDLPKNLPKGTCVKVTFRYSNSGRLAVDAFLPDVDCAARITIDRPHSITSTELVCWQALLNSGFVIDEWDLSIFDQNQPVSLDGSIPLSIATDLESEMDELLCELEKDHEQICPPEGPPPRPEVNPTVAVNQPKTPKTSKPTMPDREDDRTIDSECSKDPELQDFLKGLSS